MLDLITTFNKDLYDNILKIYLKLLKNQTKASIEFFMKEISSQLLRNIHLLIIK